MSVQNKYFCDSDHFLKKLFKNEILCSIYLAYIERFVVYPDLFRFYSASVR